MRASPHPRQAERLRALRSYDVLDTEREEAFDEIAAFAARLCGTAISVINLIDEERQWFKAETGLGVRETPLETSICSHVILETDFVEIQDTLRDPRMCDNPLCTADEGLRFYAGALLRADNGLPIGTLCVLDYEPRVLNDLQREGLQVLARQVMAQLEMRKALNRAEILRREVDHRVKNSLQSVASFARIKAASLADPDARLAVESVGQRIHAASLLHEQLYRTDAGPVVDLGQYLTNLRDYLQQGAPETVQITLNAPIAPMRVGSAVASAVGMLLTEFTANSIKHAFPDGAEGRIEIAIDRRPGRRIWLRCADNGVGMSRADVARADGLGMQVAKAACEQLGCDLHIAPGPGGFAAEITFDPGLD